MSKIKKGLMIGIGLASVAKREAKNILNILEKQGRLNKPKAKKLANSLLKKAMSKERKLQGILKKELTRDLNALKKRVKKAI